MSAQSDSASEYPDRDGARIENIGKTYASTLRGRFAAINAELRRGVQSRDVLALNSDTSDTEADIGGWGTILSRRADQFASSPFDPDELRVQSRGTSGRTGRSAVVLAWLADQHEAGLHTVATPRSNPHIQRAYTEGVNFSTKQVRGVSRISESAIPARETHLRNLRERNDRLLRGITDDHHARVSRILSDATLGNESPSDVARELTAATEHAKQRATALGRNESMVAHNTAALDGYAAAGVEWVEIVSMPDACSECVSLAADNPYRREDARGLLPVHPNCRCLVMSVE